MEETTSAQRKLARGIEHVRTLCAEAVTFEGAKAYKLRVERKPRSAKVIEYRCFAIQQQVPPSHWPLLAGDALQNLRASLEHAVWAAKTGRTRTQFPIFADTCEFQVKGRPMIRGLPAPIRALIEESQPFKTNPGLPKGEALWILSDFANLDKHRSLATVACAVDFPYIGHDGADIAWIDDGMGRELKDGAEVMSFTATSVSEPEEVKVYPDFSYQVRIEGRPLVATLVAIARVAYRVVAECESGKPLSPFAPYPI